jgi:hypothetical protein
VKFIAVLDDANLVRKSQEVAAARIEQKKVADRVVKGAPSAVIYVEHVGSGEACRRPTYDAADLGH